MSARRTELLERLNTLDASPTEDDRRAEREATLRKVAQTAEALAREGRSAAGIWSSFGRAPKYGYKLPRIHPPRCPRR
jgi:hypothetical protein